MPHNIGVLVNRPRPTPPHPSAVNGPNIHTGDKSTARGVMQAGVASGDGRDPQRPDQRRALGTGPGNEKPHGPNQLYPGGGYHPGPQQYPAPPQGPAGGYGPPQPFYPPGPQTYPGPVAPYPAPPPSTVGGYNQSGPLSKNWRQFLMNQRVQVNVVGNGWLVGFVVAFINGIQAITSSQVRVSYIDLQRQRREDTFDNDPDWIRPYH